MPQRWHVKPVLPVTKLLGAIAVCVLVLAFGRDDPVQWVLAGVTAAGLCGWALSDLIAPVRLAADPDGITVVTGFARRRRLEWAAIERVRVDRRQRLGLRSELLEVDAGEALYLFSEHQLGAPPDEVAQALAAWRTGAAGQSSTAVR
ncbi:PH domain-containing protein [Krasilnikovia sp. M28-CT-15]|uniref:PH domain-containing protein n=1 Tax=Krasilnikovia sp. M28-CT-15 TaxID=3373540 RepID=UPI003877398E